MENEIIIKYCNNIKEGKIKYTKDKLNIKYGINGTGKSTISKAIQLISKNEDLIQLKPFNSNNDENPSVSLSHPISSVLTYNDDYINQYLFVDDGDNLHYDSFSVFIKPNNYEEKVNEIEIILNDIKNTIDNNTLVNNIKVQKEQLIKMIKPNVAKTKLNDTGVAKALREGNKILSIPSEIVEYKDIIENDNKCIPWYSWFTGADDYIIDHKCPYCRKTLNENFETTREVIKNTFNIKNIENRKKTVDLLNNFTTISDATILGELKNILNSASEISNPQELELIKFMDELNMVENKFYNYTTLSYKNLENIENFESFLENNKFDLDLKYFSSNQIQQLFSELNVKIEELKSRSNELIIKKNILLSSIETNIAKNEKRINDFLKNVGMKYKVITLDNKIKLKPLDTEEYIDSKKHLSWGEKNVFALAMFIYDCLNQNPDLIILDDPVSSFDTNKKHAIIEYLFKKETNTTKTLRNKSVIMLTHDIEPIINILKVKNDRYKDIAICSHLKNFNNKISEKIITSSDVESIINVSISNYENDTKHMIHRCIHLRRYLELNNKYASEYNLLSTLLKGNIIPRFKNGVELTTDEKSLAEEELKKFIPDFNYDAICSEINMPSLIKNLYLSSTNNYEKIEIYRIASSVYPDIIRTEDILAKFINETFHIENSYIFQLNPYAYEQVPDYIVSKCDLIINTLPDIGIRT